MRAQRVTKLAMAHTNEGHFATVAKLVIIGSHGRMKVTFTR